MNTVLFPVRASAALLASLSMLALLLATIGLYGVIAFNVSRRTREIGIRMALGASQGLVVREVVIDGLMLVAAGGVIGAIAAALAGRVLAGALYGVGAFDPLAWIASFGSLAIAAIAAAVVPARRAARVNPIAALRSAVVRLDACRTTGTTGTDRYDRSMERAIARQPSWLWKKRTVDRNAGSSDLSYLTYRSYQSVPTRSWPAQLFYFVDRLTTL